ALALSPKQPATRRLSKMLHRAVALLRQAYAVLGIRAQDVDYRLGAQRTFHSLLQIYVALIILSVGDQDDGAPRGLIILDAHELLAGDGNRVIKGRFAFRLKFLRSEERRVGKESIV